MKKYHILLVDPPWEYRDKKKSGRTKCGAENHYSCMSLEEIKALPIQNIAEDNCILYLWTTFPLLDKAFEVISAWGFIYKTAGFNWVKTNKDGSIWHGVGAFSKSNIEPCLMAVKGNVGRLVKDQEGNVIKTDPKVKLSVQSNFVSQVIISPRRKHSQKPPEVHNKIVELWGDISRVELFSRNPVEGWDAIGNEIDGKDIREVLTEL